MSTKRAELDKRKGREIANQLRRAGNPYPRASDPAADRRTRRERDRALGLVPFAVKLPAGLVQAMRAEAQARAAPLDDLVAEWLRRGMEGPEA